MRNSYFALSCLVISAMGCLPAFAHAASFDCGKASTNSEKLICASKSLGRLDEELAKLYQRDLSTYDDVAAQKSVRERQRKWLREERDTCKDANCVGTVMLQRALMLRTSIERARGKTADIAETFTDVQVLLQSLAREQQATTSATSAGPAQQQAAPATALQTTPQTHEQADSARPSKDWATQERERLAAMPVYASAEIGNTGHAHFVNLEVVNKSKKGFYQIDVVCTLHKDSPVPVEPTELRWSITGNIAPESTNFREPNVRIPWDGAKWYKAYARSVRCNTLKTVESSAQDMKYAIEIRDQTKRDLEDRVAAYNNALSEEASRRHAEVGMDQHTRLTSALQQANRGSSHCQLLARAYVGQLPVVSQYEGAGVSAVGLVDRLVGDLRRNRCL